MSRDYVLAFDTANEVIAVGVGKLDRFSRTLTPLASKETPAFRSSNTKLIFCIDAALEQAGVVRDQLASIVCGRGPGSFTGVRICMATAKGIALGQEISLYGVSTLDAQAWECWNSGVRGELVVVGDAMRREVYPLRYLLGEQGISRLNSEFVLKANECPAWIGEGKPFIAGDALNKYENLFSDCALQVAGVPHHPTGEGLLCATQALWDANLFDPDNKELGNPLTLLPIYTRLSDAEEHERQKFAQQSLLEADKGAFSGNLFAKNLVSGVQGDVRSSVQSASENESTVVYQPLDVRWVEDVARLESSIMGSDAWNASQVAEELPRSDRSWWAAYITNDKDRRIVDPTSAMLVGYAGGWILDGDLQLLKIGVEPKYRRDGVASELLLHLARDARDLGATTISLEVRRSNESAHRFYEKMGLVYQGCRPRYYSDREDAFIYAGPLPLERRDVAGMSLRINDATSFVKSPQNADESDGGSTSLSDHHKAELPERERPLVAFETSCDETAAAIISQEGELLSDVVASQIDFHARFGGVVPEIASRKHIEAIAGVAQECLDRARISLKNPDLTWRDIGAIAVTYAPGLVGALVVGLAFAKGLAWSCDLPLIGVNHLEGHLYANRLVSHDIQPPLLVSLVSGGHTMLVYVKDWGVYETLGSTLDDAVGEAFDKVAKALGLGYPGGPLISRLAQSGNPKAIDFPRALLHSGNYDFSLSGLKTAVLTYLQKEQQAGRHVNASDVAASFQQAVIDVQVAKVRRALEETGAKEFCVGGGVAANPALRKAYEQLCQSMNVRLTMPPLSACTDNASMIALVALDRFKQEKFFGFECDVAAHVNLDEPY